MIFCPSADLRLSVRLVKLSTYFCFRSCALTLTIACFYWLAKSRPIQEEDQALDNPQVGLGQKEGAMSVCHHRS